MTGLENAIAGPSSSEEWLTGVDANLAELRRALEEHIRTAEGTDGLFDEIMATSPRLAAEMESLRDEHRQLVDGAVSHDRGSPLRKERFKGAPALASSSDESPRAVDEAQTTWLGSGVRRLQRGYRRGRLGLLNEHQT